MWMLKAIGWLLCICFAGQVVGFAMLLGYSIREHMWVWAFLDAIAYFLFVRWFRRMLDAMTTLGKGTRSE